MRKNRYVLAIVVVLMLSIYVCKNLHGAVIGSSSKAFHPSGAFEVTDLRTDWTYRQVITDKNGINYVNVGNWIDFGDHIELKNFIFGDLVTGQNPLAQTEKRTFSTKKSLFRPQHF